VLKMDQCELIRTGCRVYGQNVSAMAKMTRTEASTISCA
jgi:hypothetical protein